MAAETLGVIRQRAVGRASSLPFPYVPFPDECLGKLFKVIPATEDVYPISTTVVRSKTHELVCSYLFGLQFLLAPSLPYLFVAASRQSTMFPPSFQQTYTARLTQSQS